MEELKNKKVLIVDDEERNTYALRSYLESHNLKTEVVSNGKEAIDLLIEDIKVDIILLDMMMPVMDGYETLAYLKENDLLKNIPVIAVTANAMKGDREKCLEAGAWDYISKPIDLAALLSIMKQWMK